MCWILLAGQFIAYLHNIRNQPTWFGNFQSDSSIVRIISDPISKNDYTTFEGKVIVIKENGKWINTCGNAIIQANILQPQVTKGSSILIISTPVLIKTSGNYTNYLHQKNIFHRYYLKKGNYTIIFSPKQISVVEKIRAYILSVIDQYIKKSDSNALSKALLIGHRSDMDKNTINAFRNTGVIHVISVSGMHLALIYTIFNSILKFIFSKSMIGRIQRIGINLIVLWTFSILCGGAPSVLRSAVMFSFILLGELFYKNNFTSNAIAGSAFCLLCIDPSMIKDLGFLLSYAAVIGLHVYNKPISHVFHPKNKLLMHGWEVFATSVSAQILTAPIIIYQFGKFPVLFLLSNLIAVPITSMLLLILIFLCMIAPLKSLSAQIGSLVELLSEWLINKMNTLGNLSISTIEIKMDLAETFFVYALIVVATFFLFTKKTPFLWFFLGINLIIPIYELFIKWVYIR